MHFYQKNIPDFNNATRHLTRVERSLFSDAIELYYDTEKPLTNDIHRLERLLLAQSDEEKSALKTVLDEFFVLNEDGYFNKRCNEEILKYQSYIVGKSKAGKASAEQRNKQKATGVEQVLNTTPTNYKPITNNHKPIKNINAKKVNFFADIPESLVFDYLQVRKAKRAPTVSKTVYDGILRESALAGITIEQALTVCVERNWVGFKADWYVNIGQNSTRQARDLSRQIAAKSVFKPEHTMHLMGNKELEVNDAKTIAA